MTPDELLREVVNMLEELDVPYAIGGSLASIAYGEPPATLDIDVVVDVERRQIEGRRRLPALLELEAYFSPPEELILKKLQYFADGGSDKHLRDISAMLAISPDEIDRDEVGSRAEALGLSHLWRVVSGGDS